MRKGERRANSNKSEHLLQIPLTRHVLHQLFGDALLPHLGVVAADVAAQDRVALRLTGQPNLQKVAEAEEFSPIDPSSGKCGCESPVLSPTHTSYCVLNRLSTASSTIQGRLVAPMTTTRCPRLLSLKKRGSAC